MTETFHEEDTVKLSEEQLKEVHRLREDLELRTRDPAAYYAMLAQRSQVANAQSLARHSQFDNVTGVGQAPANVTPTPLGYTIPHHYSNHEDWRLACQAGVNAIQAMMSSIPGASDSMQIIGSSSVLPIQDQPNTVVSNTISAVNSTSTAVDSMSTAVDSTSTAGRVTSDLQLMKDSLKVSEGRMPDLTAVQPNPPQVRTDNIALVNARIGKQNSISEEARRANMKDWDAAAAASTAIFASKSTAKKQNAATPNRTGTPTSGKPQKPTTPSKTASGKLAQTTHGTPSRASSSSPGTSKHLPATNLVTADTRRLLRSNSRASSASAHEPKQKPSSTTPSAARACSTSFNSSFDSLNDAFLSGSGSHPGRQRASK